MNRRQIIRSLARTALGILTCISGAGPAAAAGTAPGNKRDKLRIGESMQFDSDLKITFFRVADDSRCPINARCISAGNAEIILRIETRGQPAKNHRLNTDAKPRFLAIHVNPKPGHIGIPKSYAIKIHSLLPLPTAGKKTRKCDYRLRLRIDVAQ